MKVRETDKEGYRERDREGMRYNKRCYCSNGSTKFRSDHSTNF